MHSDTEEWGLRANDVYLIQGDLLAWEALLGLSLGLLQILGYHPPAHPKTLDEGHCSGLCIPGIYVYTPVSEC